MHDLLTTWSNQSPSSLGRPSGLRLIASWKLERSPALLSIACQNSRPAPGQWRPPPRPKGQSLPAIISNGWTLPKEILGCRRTVALPDQICGCPWSCAQSRQASLIHTPTAPPPPNASISTLSPLSLIYSPPLSVRAFFACSRGLPRFPASVSRHSFWFFGPLFFCLFYLPSHSSATSPACGRGSATAQLARTIL